jgi:hydrogenase maturation factor
MSAMKAAGISSACIGRAVERERGVVLRNGRAEHPIRRFARDEIARLFE